MSKANIILKVSASQKANQLTDNSRAAFCGSNGAQHGADLPYTPEEDAEFARIERNHEIALMANVIRSTVRTHSAEGIATRLFEAGYRFDSSAVCLK